MCQELLLLKKTTKLQNQAFLFKKRFGCEQTPAGEMEKEIEQSQHRQIQCPSQTLESCEKYFFQNCSFDKNHFFGSVEKHQQNVTKIERYSSFYAGV